MNTRPCEVFTYEVFTYSQAELAKLADLHDAVETARGQWDYTAHQATKAREAYRRAADAHDTYAAWLAAGQTP
jgi:hypothetical protein